MTSYLLAALRERVQAEGPLGGRACVGLRCQNGFRAHIFKLMQYDQGHVVTGAYITGVCCVASQHGKYICGGAQVRCISLEPQSGRRRKFPRKVLQAAQDSAATDVTDTSST